MSQEIVICECTESGECVCDEACVSGETPMCECACDTCSDVESACACGGNCLCQDSSGEYWG